ncbi:hypothetical protein [Crassaminicella profunda]|uniref:hypothetical protein n=1 Tax=Crassaminicella profunda TaxID=1286698 RepID=UPI001CA63385|nr:hypothetical protein [Crassaminicella profunda]QZY53903.1 hypothetical protein K7H06_12660 [Crassaminicella profunda]
MFILEIVMPIVALAVTLPYLYPVILLPKIILCLLSGEYTSNMELLRKERNKSIRFFILDIVLWFPIVFIGWMSTDAPSTSSFHISVVEFLTYVPIFALACVIITIIVMIIESRKAKAEHN